MVIIKNYIDKRKAIHCYKRVYSSENLNGVNMEDAIKKRAEKLKKVIDDYRYRYHVLDDPTLSDQVYDSLMDELRKLEEKYPALKTPDSPTQRIGGKPLEKFEKVKHRVRQWSLDDVFSFEELKDWEDRNRRILEKKGVNSNFDYVVELKIDGLKIVLDYEKGFLVQGATRGDGVIGEKVTENIKTIRSVPLKIKKELDLTVTGECWLPNKELQRINKERRKKNLPEFANSRNAGAGSIRQLDSKIAASRNLDSYIYSLDEIRSEKSKIPSTQKEELEFLIELGFKVNPEFQHFKKIEENDLHIHVPDGATPKDGPSAGLAITTAIISLYSNIPINKSVAMTGEISLHGKAMEIGGLREKIIAAAKAGIKTVIKPEDNEKDLSDIPTEVLSKLDIKTVNHINQVLDIALIKKIKKK